MISFQQYIDEAKRKFVYPYAVVKVDPNNTQTIVKVFKTFKTVNQGFAFISQKDPNWEMREPDYDPWRVIDGNNADEYTWKVKSPF